MHNKDKEILEYLSEIYPEEGCGLLVNKKGKIYWVPCENVAENKKEDFIISAEDYIKASLSGDIYAIVHSHPDSSCEPSDYDKKTSDFWVYLLLYILYQVLKNTNIPLKS